MDKLESILDSVNGWLRFAEAKNLALMTLSGAGIWGCLRLIGDPDLNTLLVCYLAQLVFFLVLSLVAALISFLPITRYSILVPTKKVSENSNLAFFGDLAHYRARNLVSALASAVGESETEASEFHKMVAEQVIVNSRIALTKYRFFTWGFYAFLLGLLTPLVGLLAIYGASQKRRAVDGY